jgi:putative flippase GtrA
VSVLLRYIIVGAANTVVGYATILLGLKLGAGDYISNAAGYALGMMMSYILHRRWTFEVAAAASFSEAGRFGAAAIAAYATNLSVIYVGRTAGYVDNPYVQATAMISYSITFFLMSRFFVFAEAKTAIVGKFEEDS